jgi:hypothetical protein
MFKIGDMVENGNINTMYRYGLVKKIEGTKVYCLWSGSFLDLKRKKYVCSELLWASDFNIKIAEEKIIKQYGIVAFMKGIV